MCNYQLVIGHINDDICNYQLVIGHINGFLSNYQLAIAHKSPQTLLNRFTTLHFPIPSFLFPNFTA